MIKSRVNREQSEPRTYRSSSRKGLSDIFNILSEAAFLIRKPLDTDELSGFTTYFEEQFIVYLNSNFTLGHERYTGAYELYHLIYNADILKKEKILLDDEKHKAEDTKADVFAFEFLMPEDYVKEVFYKIVSVDKNNVLPRLLAVSLGRGLLK